MSSTTEDLKWGKMLYAKTPVKLCLGGSRIVEFRAHCPHLVERLALDAGKIATMSREPRISLPKLLENGHLLRRGRTDFEGRQMNVPSRRTT